MFPRKAGVPKKGLVADTAKETLEKVVAQQNTEKTVLGKTPAVLTKRVKPVKISADMLKEKVYRKLRLERMNQKHHGKRMKKAQEAEKQKWEEQRK